jgi:hypothetical protein
VTRLADAIDKTSHVAVWTCSHERGNPPAHFGPFLSERSAEPFVPQLHRVAKITDNVRPRAPLVADAGYLRAEAHVSVGILGRKGSMNAVVYQEPYKVTVEEMPDPNRGPERHDAGGSSNP